MHNTEAMKFISENKITDYVPHRGKMLLLSRITDCDPEKHIITCEYDITKDCIFYEKEGDGIPSWVSFELLAQTVCALSGISHKFHGKNIVPGMILSIMAFKTEREWLKAGETARMVMTEYYRDEESAFCNYIGELYIVGEEEKPAVTMKISAIEIENLELLKEIRERYVQ